LGRHLCFSYLECEIAFNGITLVFLKNRPLWLKLLRPNSTGIAWTTLFTHTIYRGVSPPGRFAVDYSSVLVTVVGY